MNDTERFLFDCHGYLHIPGLLRADEVAALLEASRGLERHALACETVSPKFRAIIGFEYWQSLEYGYYATYADTSDSNRTLVVDDFWLYSSMFDLLVGHE